MIDAIRYEIVRLKTIRSTYWLTGSALFIGLAIGVLFGLTGRHEFNRTPPNSSDVAHMGAYIVTQFAATGAPNLPGFLLAIIGIFAWGHEYRHGQIRASLTALNSRTNLWAAKFLVVGVWVAIFTFLTGLIGGAAAQIFVHPWANVLDAEAFQVLLRLAIANTLLCWIAMAFTSLTRSQAFALVTLFLWPLLIESLFNVIFSLIPGLRDHTGVLRFLPFSAERRIVSVMETAHSTFGDPLSALGGTIVWGGVAAALMVASYLVFLRRDA